jgi:hypothetical protein
MPRWLAALAWIWTAAVTAAALQRPEIAQTVIEKASDILPIPQSLKPSATSTVEVENRPSTVDAPHGAEA